MSDELRIKAEQLVKSWDYVNALLPMPDGPMKDEAEFARLWLAEHPADDGDSLDKAYLRTLGSVERDDGRVLTVFVTKPESERFVRVFAEKLLYESGTVYSVGIGIRPNNIFVTVATRGDVRRLCAVMGVTLKEQPCRS